VSGIPPFHTHTHGDLLLWNIVPMKQTGMLEHSALFIVISCDIMSCFWFI